MASWFADPVIVSVWVACGIVAAMVGTMRLKESPVTWGIVGLLLGPFAIIWALLKTPA